MRISFLLPLVFLGLAGCVDVHEHPTPTPAATVVTPAPAPTATYVAPAPPDHDHRAHALIGAAFRIDRRGPGHNPALFICAAPWCRRRYPCRLELLDDRPLPRHRAGTGGHGAADPGAAQGAHPGGMRPAAGARRRHPGTRLRRRGEPPAALSRPTIRRSTWCACARSTSPPSSRSAPRSSASAAPMC